MGGRTEGEVDVQWTETFKRSRIMRTAYTHYMMHCTAPEHLATVCSLTIMTMYFLCVVVYDV